MSKYGTRESCACDQCQSACQMKPGWFMPGEVRKLREKMSSMSLESFKGMFGVDWWEDDKDDVFVLAPKTLDMVGGREYPVLPGGQCAFYHDGICTIHTHGKPWECRQMLHGDTPEMVAERKRLLIAAWAGAQDEIREFLGRDPAAAPSAVRAETQYRTMHPEEAMPQPAENPKIIAYDTPIGFVRMNWGGEVNITCMRIDHPEYGPMLLGMTKQGLRALRELIDSTLASMEKIGG